MKNFTLSTGIFISFHVFSNHQRGILFVRRFMYICFVSWRSLSLYWKLKSRRWDSYSKYLGSVNSHQSSALSIPCPLFIWGIKALLRLLWRMIPMWFFKYLSCIVRTSNVHAYLSTPSKRVSYYGHPNISYNHKFMPELEFVLQSTYLS